MDDEELIDRIAGGDEAAMRLLFVRHAPWLAARLRSVLPAPDVQDVLQETFLAVWRGARGYRGHGAAAGWLWGIAVRRAARWLRDRGPSVGALDSGREPDSGQDVADLVAGRADLAEAVRALGPADGPERQVWQLLYVEDRSVAEVASLLDVPAGTVKSRAHRVRRLLRAALRRDTPAREGGT